MSSFVRNYLNKFRLFYSHKINRILIVIAVFFAITFSLIYYLSLKFVEKTLYEQMLHREQIVTRAGSIALKEFFELMGTQVFSFSTRKSIVNVDKDTQNLLDTFVARYSQYPIGGIVLTDKNGKIIYNANAEDSHGTNTDLSDRDYFIDLKNNIDKEYVISSPLISRFGVSKGKYVLIIASPVINNNKFNGVLLISVIIDEIAKEFLNPLKITENTLINLNNEKGDLLYSTRGVLINLDYLKTEDNKVGEWKNISKDGLLIATSSFNYWNGNFWYLSAATPSKDALDFMGPLLKINFAFLLIGIFSILIFSSFLITVIKLIRKK
ncbi:MAG: cache domain-containing protein [Candidatus Woesebacteria bacterium]|nr:cache domain-containing protein [Candidatus Woesebacteria bacterium]